MTTQIPDTIVEATARALYAIEWEAVSGNLRDGHFDYESEDVREYWRKSARAALTVAVPLMVDNVHQERATARARRNAVEMAVQQIEFLQGKRKRAWDGDFLKRICDAASSDRIGCLTCGGSMMVSGPPVDIALPGAPDCCPDCDPGAPGFVPILPPSPAEGEE